MSKEVTFRCDLCNIEIHALKAGQQQTGIGLSWKTSKHLEIGLPWMECPVHLCLECVRAVRDMSEELVSLKMI